MWHSIPARLLQLYKAFKHTKSHKNDTHSNPTFEQAVMKLISRYPVVPKTDADKKRVQTRWKTPEKFMAALRNGFQATTERFASPLNFSTHFDTHFSAHEED